MCPVARPTDGTGFADQLGQGLEEEIETPSLITGEPEEPVYVCRTRP